MTHTSLQLLSQNGNYLELKLIDKRIIKISTDSKEGAGELKILAVP